MDTTIKVTGDWEAQKANLKQRFEALTNNGLIPGEEEKKDVLEKLQIEVIKTHDQLVDWKMRVMMLLKNTVLTGTMILAVNNITHAQGGKLYLKGENKINTTIDMVTGQYGDSITEKKHVAPSKAKDAVSQPAIKSTAINVVASDQMFGEDKYLKTKETGKRYKEFQVFDVNGMDMDEVMRGLLTSSLDRDTRYTEKGPVEKKASVAIINGFIPKLDAQGNVVRNAEKVNVSAISFKDKVFVIVGEHDYRYLDGKRLVGGQKLVDELMKGKPVTETTFFFELKKAGILDDAMTLLQFSKMDLSEQQSLLKSGAIAADF